MNKFAKMALEEAISELKARYDESTARVNVIIEEIANVN